MDLKGKKVLVLGLARTGVATVRFLVERGARVKVSEMKPPRELEGALQELKGLPLDWEMGGHTLPFFLDAELIVVSPGVPMDLQPLRQAREKGLPAVSEIELASRFLRRPMIAITGTNGKTTTTTLMGEMFRAGGKAAFVGGNIGNPLMNFVAGSQREEWAVVEVSSFQLEGIDRFRPRVALLLNITEDHLDRHPSFQEYGEIKGRIFQNQGKEDYAVLNADDPRTFQFAHRVRSQVVLFSRERSVPWGCFLDRGSIIFQGAEGEREDYGLGRMRIRGTHNLENFMAAIAACRICGCPRGALQKVIDGFEGLEHRLEWVGNIDGVNFYNDSKGTNVGAVVKSLLSFEEPVLLIAGGRDKEGDYGPLRGLVAEKVRGMALIGEARERMSRVLGDLTETLQAESLEEAVSWARSKARPGDVVLLSPACSSFDMFLNYQERGRRFKAIIHELQRGKSSRSEKEGTPG
jgi:UDP-N-acetylmuramoylalanine--D-glutamate ligase